MENFALQTLEAAAQVLLAPPNIVSPEQRHQAESVFLEFRNTKVPYQLCREILEKSSVDYVLFEAAGLMKTAIIREWNLLSENDINSLREYLLNYLMSRDCPTFLKEKLLQTIAIIIKRCSIDDSGRERKAFLSELEKLILTGPIVHQKLACSLIQAIMQEYAITVKSADVGLIWEVHYKLKRMFEIDLKRIFRFMVSVLEQIIRSGHRPEGEHAVLTKQLLSIVEMVLCWGHSSPLLRKRLIGAFEAIYECEVAPALRLGIHWRDTILQPEVIALFFEIHMYVRNNPNLITHSMICLVQLTSLSGVLVDSDNDKQRYLENYVNSFLNMMSNITQPSDKEVLGIADIYRRLVQFFTMPMISSLPPAFLQNLTSLTCHCMKAAVAEEGVNDDTVWRESMNKFLHCWCSLVHDADGFSQETLRNPCIELFNTYLQCRLGPPDGTRSAMVNSDIEDAEDDERQIHLSVLLTIGSIARMAPAHCFHVLFSLLQSRGKRLQEQLQLLHMGKMQLSHSQDLDGLYDDLHWIIMITGHFLAVDCLESETILIPPELIMYSISENADVDASLTYLTQENAPSERVDSIIKVVAEVLRINSCELAAHNAGLGSVFSPELSATISWFLSVWANTYLIKSTPTLTKLPDTLVRAWSREGVLSEWAVGVCVSRVRHVLRLLSGQPCAVTYALKLLITLTCERYDKNPVASCDEFLALVAWEASGSNLTGEQRKELHRAFSMAATYAKGEVRNRILASTASLNSKLMTILNSNIDNEMYRVMLADTVDSYIGVVEGVQEVGQSDEQMLMLLEALDKMPIVLFRYHNYPSVVLPVLTFLTKSGKKFINSSVKLNCTKYLEICMSAFDVYGKWNAGKISSIPQDAEEEAYEDIMTLIEMTCSIGRCGIMSEVAETVTKGLKLILPMITASLLAMPKLAHSAYRMIRDLNTADHLINLPIDDFNMVVNALRIGLTAVSCDVSTLCCDTIVGLANKAATLGNDNPYSLSLLTLAELLLMLIVKMEIPGDTIPSAGAAIYGLTCLKPALLEGLASQLVEAIAANDPANVPRLQEAFGVLTNGVIFNGRRPQKLRFQENFDKFLTSVHGFLIVK